MGLFGKPHEILQSPIFHYGSTIGSLLNVNFGNASEIIIGILAINAGLIDLAKDSINDSILGNIMPNRFKDCE